MKLNKKIALAFPVAALAVMGGASTAAAVNGNGNGNGEEFTLNLLNCIALDAAQAPILSDDDNTVDCSKEIEKSKTTHGFSKLIAVPSSHH